MGFKDWPYWLKGGTIGAIIYIPILFLIGLLLPSFKLILLMIPLEISYILCTNRLCMGTMFYISSIILGALIGSLIGWIVGIKRSTWWLKWGFLGIIFGIIFVLFIFSIPGADYWATFFLYPGFLLGPIIKLLPCSGEECWGWFIVLGILVTLFAFFLVGVLIGWVVKKIKNRKQGQIEAPTLPNIKETSQK